MIWHHVLPIYVHAHLVYVSANESHCLGFEPCEPDVRKMLNKNCSKPHHVTSIAENQWTQSVSTGSKLIGIFMVLQCINVYVYTYIHTRVCTHMYTHSKSLGVFDQTVTCNLLRTIFFLDAMANAMEESVFWTLWLLWSRSGFLIFSYLLLDRKKQTRKGICLFPQQEPDQMAAIFGPFLNQDQPSQIDSARCR